jgi:hypothetical protein
MRSPACRPARAAGDAGSTAATKNSAEAMPVWMRRCRFSATRSAMRAR